jgi:hypothetical protein
MILNLEVKWRSPRTIVTDRDRSLAGEGIVRDVVSVF